MAGILFCTPECSANQVKSFCIASWQYFSKRTTRCRAAHYSPECALDTAVNTLHTRFLDQIQCAMHSKNLHYSNVCIASDKNEVEA